MTIFFRYAIFNYLCKHKFITIPGKLCEKFALFPLSDIEKAGCENLLQKSQHCKMVMLPNHHINEDSEMEGFYFEAHCDDKASLLPLNKKLCEMTCLYELNCANEKDHVVNNDALKIFNNLEEYKQIMQTFMQTIQNNCTAPASFDCIPVVEEASAFTNKIVDQRVFSESVPEHVGIYHAYSQNERKTGRKHCLYIIVSGFLPEASEEFYNLWLDARNSISTEQLCDSAELHWLRDATLRNHNRIASQLAAAMNLPCKNVYDFCDPRQSCKMLIPTTLTAHYDIRKMKNKNVGVVSKGCFIDFSKNGVLFDTNQFDGFTLFCGNKDNAAGNKYGLPLDSNSCYGFPTKNVEYFQHCPVPQSAKTVVVNNRKFLFPDERFYDVLQKLGFDRNNDALNLMPLVTS